MAYETPCPFCAIANTYPPEAFPVPANPDPEALSTNCYLLLSTETVMAFLDIMPIERGHVLIIPRSHRDKLKDLEGGEGASLGAWLPVLSRAVMRALGQPNGDWNVVQNNGMTLLLTARAHRVNIFPGAAAAQVVPHVHYHIIPRGHRPEVVARSWAMFGRGQRTDLDDDDATLLARLIRSEIHAELQNLGHKDAQAHRLLGKL